MYQQHLRREFRARLEAPEDQAAVHELARLIAQTELNAMPADFLGTLEMQEGMTAFWKASPNSVDSFLFRCVRKGAGQAGTETAITEGRKRRPPDPAKLRQSYIVEQ